MNVAATECHELWGVALSGPLLPALTLDCFLCDGIKTVRILRDTGIFSNMMLLVVIKAEEHR